VVYIEKVQSSAQTIQLVTYVGGTLPAHATALGKVLVANLPPDERVTWLEEHEYVSLTKHTFTDAASMEHEIRACRDHGYAVDDEEFHEGVMCIAAPVFNHTSRVIAALSVTGIKSRWLANGP
jgi:IclR family transcriptional regulator, acetate operon repressor